MPHNGRKNANETMLRALACGATVDAAAHSAGVSRSTAHRRLKDPAFLAQIAALRADTVQRTAAMLTASALESVKTLMELQKPTNTGSGRLGAARAVLEIGVKLREAADLEERLAALEGRAALDRGRCAAG